MHITNIKAYRYLGLASLLVPALLSLLGTEAYWCFGCYYAGAPGVPEAYQC